MPTFTCTNCKKESSFQNRKTEHLFEWRSTLNQESRTYNCEHCATPNVVKMTKGEWKNIDRSRLGDL